MTSIQFAILRRDKHVHQSIAVKRCAQFKCRFLLVFIVGTVMSFPILEFTGGDRWLSSIFYDAQTHSWPLCDREPYSTIDHASVWLTSGLAITCVVVSVATWLVQRKRGLNRNCLVLSLLALIGPVLLINTCLKPAFSRARPREIVEFGGPMSYTPAWQTGSSPFRNSSFPSGHASIGFYLLAPALLVRRHRRLFVVLFMVGLGFGSVVCYSRLAQGGHFVSDMVCSMLVMTSLAWGISEAAFRWWPVRIRPRRMLPPPHYQEPRYLRVFERGTCPTQIERGLAMTLSSTSSR